MELNWIKCTNHVWCNFFNVNLNNKDFNNLNGVCIIWTGETNVKFSSVEIKARIAGHKDNKEILKDSNLKVTWVKVDINQMEKLKEYLVDTLKPVVGERFANITSIEKKLTLS